MTFRERQQALATFKERTVALRAAAETLEAGMAASKEKAARSDEEFFTAVQAQYHSLAGGLLTGMVRR